MLKLIIDKMKGTEEGNLGVVLDKEFHHKLAGAAHNILIFNMMNVTSWLVDAY
jgi:DNA-binding FadR family transcriptional regulator